MWGGGVWEAGRGGQREDERSEGGKMVHLFHHVQASVPPRREVLFKRKVGRPVGRGGRVSGTGLPGEFGVDRFTPHLLRSWLKMSPFVVVLT